MEKSTLVKRKVNASADVAVACLGLTWRLGGVTRGREEVLAHRDACRRVTAHRIFRWRVKVCPVLKAAVFCSVELSVSRAFQRYRRCLDQSPRTANPRVAVGPFGYESASWQRDDRISDRGGAEDS
jgi:hypothetical protein